ncbi:MAG TPA: HAD-IC family P-type ATPase, partial [Saprospiraceae bacterium]|nr:HAD-IC family P-type ATPase [Saprospiraceae bacterium]
MNVKIQLPPDLQGLSDDAVLQSRKIHGMNVQHHEDASTWWKVLLNLLKEPMLILLIGVALIYILLGQTSDAYFMLFAIVIVSGISFYQDHRSKTSLKALEVFNTPLSQVIRNGKVEQIPTPDIVPGDLVMNEEGSTLQADGEIRYSHDFSINESTLTGESQPVYKSESRSDGQVYQGTWVSSGLVVFEAKSTGLHTKMGQLGTSLLAIKEEQTPLQGQIRRFVRNMTFVGILVFFLLWGVHFYKTHLLLDSLLKGMTLAMSILPEEIPVAFTSFMAIGAWKMMQRGIIVKKMQTVEALGSITVLCADKTGTITENRMSFAGLFSNLSRKTYDEESAFDHPAMEVIEAAMWSSEPLPYDPMETTIHQLYADHAVKDQRPFYKMIHEYPLSGSPPMMTHLHENENGDRIIAAKGAPETILRLCPLAP